MNIRHFVLLCLIVSVWAAPLDAQAPTVDGKGVSGRRASGVCRQRGRLRK